MKKYLIFSFIIIALSNISTANAEQNYQADVIANGDLAAAEAKLIAVLDKTPDDPYALLNLAFVYQKAGNQVKAREIYYRILSLRNNPYAELASGDTERVKSIAQRGIERVETQN
ncbi:MAG: tetratricopeptide repeat protein [Gammaproteobacteria bacterium]|nr:tetratricopeptide repeat protein [Gammaproteobacteria bacterium]